MSENLIANKINQERLVPVVTTEFSVEENLKNDASPLALTAEARIISIDSYQGEAKLFGHVNFKIMYAGAEAGETETVDFNESVYFDAFTGGSKIKAVVSVKETDFVKGRMIATVKVEIMEITNDEIDISPENETILQKKETVFMPNLIKESSLVAEIFFEEKIADMGALISDSVEVVSTGAKIINGVLTAEGVVSVSLVYMAGGYPCTKLFKQSFSEEICSDLVAEDTNIAVEMNVKSCRIVVSEDVLKIEVTVTVETLVFKETEYKLPVDCFSTRYEIDTTEADIDLSNYVQSVYFDEKLSHTEEITGVKSLLACCYPKNCIMSQEIQGENLVVGGIVRATLVYIDTEDALKSSVVELPYSVSTRIPKNTNMAIVNGIVTGFDAKLKRDGNIEIFADLRFAAKLFRKRSIRILSDMNILSEKEDDLAAISLYIVNEGDTMWDVMCALCASEESIKDQNPEIFENGKTGLDIGERVIIFRP